MQMLYHHFCLVGKKAANKQNKKQKAEYIFHNNLNNLLFQVYSFICLMTYSIFRSTMIYIFSGFVTVLNIC